MRIGLVGEPEMADVLGAVDGLGQRSQHHRLQQLRVGTVLDTRQQPGVVLRLRVIAAREMEAELLQKLRSCSSFSGGGPSCTR